jgi:hypothetical protein
MLKVRADALDDAEAWTLRSNYQGNHYFTRCEPRTVADLLARAPVVARSEHS